ncbi:MAG TPA: hypothetical protein VGO61_01280 [Steroidobacteraceae bacterium]|jgi:hypothetical protein|nr:hypothetical protein [Steroidobacteraceae bacterium]
MNYFKTIVISGLLIAAGATAAADAVRGVVHEVQADAIALPASVPGTVVVTACSSCPVFSVETNENTVFEINDVAVRIAAMRAALLAQPNALVFLKTTPDNRQLVLLSITSAVAP